MADGMMMHHAAKRLEIGKTTLFRRLRELGVLDHRNRPRRDLVREGYFVEETRTYEKKSDHFAVAKLYTVTLVTEKGVRYLQSILRPQEPANVDHTRVQAGVTGAN